MIATLEPDSKVPPTELVRGLKLSSEAKAVVPTARNARELVDKLVAARRAEDAVRVMLHALPRRYALAWTCECLRRDYGKTPLSPADAACLESAEICIMHESDEMRRTAAERGEAAEHETPASWAAMAAAWGGGSLSPRGAVPVPPPPRLAADACCTAVILLAAREPTRLQERLAEWIERALASFGPPRPAAR